MFFSVISPSEGAVRQAAYESSRSAYESHQWIWTFFPAERGHPRDFIFRRQMVGQLPRFYVVSQRPPAASTAASTAAWRVDTKPYDPKLERGQRLSFNLCANPVVTKKREGRDTSSRHDVVMQAKKDWLANNTQLLDQAAPLALVSSGQPKMADVVQSACSDWINARAALHGFELGDFRVDAYEKHNAERRNIRFSTVEFSGNLVVTDEQLFRKALLTGIGHAKAFGCGMLLVKKISGD